MAVEPKKYYAPANRGQVASVAIQLSVALVQIKDALEGLAGGNTEGLKDKLDRIDLIADQLEDHYDRLTGYREDKDEG